MIALHRLGFGPALVCKTWRDTALGLQWRVTYLETILRQIGVLRDQQLKRWVSTSQHPRSVNAERDYYPQVTRRTASIEDWDYFQNIACRVHRLIDWSSCQLTDTVIGALSVYRPSPTSPLFTNLKSADFDASRISNLPQLLSFLPLTLQSLKICLSKIGGSNVQVNPPATEATTLAFLSLLPHRLPNLQALELRRGSRTRDIFKKVVDVLPKLEKLKSLTIRHTLQSPTILQSLASLPDLEIIDTYFESKHWTGVTPGFQPSDFDWIPTACPECAFPNLHILIADLPLTGGTAVMLQDIAATHSLETLRLRQLGDANELRRVAQGIAAHRKLKHLALLLEPAALKGISLHDVGSCNELETLEIVIKLQGPSGDTNLADGILRSALEGLINLEKLTAVVSEAGEPCLTLGTLVHAISSCPRLREVTLITDARVHVEPSETTQPHSSLEVFRTYLALAPDNTLDSYINSPALPHVVLLLAEVTDLPLDIEHTGQPMWEEVERTVPRLYEFRMRERRRTTRAIEEQSTMSMRIG